MASQTNLEEVLSFIEGQSGTDCPYRKLGEIDREWVDIDYIRSLPYGPKITHGSTTGSTWSAAHKWDVYFTTFKGDKRSELLKPIDDLVLSFFPSGTQIYSGGIFRLKAGGYIMPHADDIITQEIYIPLYWPASTRFVYENFGDIVEQSGDILALDITKHHAVMNASIEDRYVYIILVADETGAMRLDYIRDLLDNDSGNSVSSES